MRNFLFLSLVVIISSCAPYSKKSLTKTMIKMEKELQQHAGLMIYDLDANKTIFEYQSDRYYTPASNTKIFTFYTALKILGDSVPAFHYLETNDSIILWGTGDPSFLYKNVYNNGRVFSFLTSTTKPLYLSTANYHTSNFGNGWAWDDYNSAYSAERSPFPVYGDIFTVSIKEGKPFVQPKLFNQFFSEGEPKEHTQVQRKFESNDFTFHWGTRRSSLNEWNVPIKINQKMICDLLSDTLGRVVTPVNTRFGDSTLTYQTIYSIPTDSLYSVMMQDSDNFIAEQLLFLCSDIISDSLQTEIAIDYSKKNFLNDLQDEPIWVDGSGLSRYNLFTPRSIVALWKKIGEVVPRERLLPLLATGGVNGTVKNWYKGDKPYVFGKTGTLSNVHALSGFLVTRSGKTLIFSFMNNNYVQSTNKVRTNMQDILKMLYEKY